MKECIVTMTYEIPGSEISVSIEVDGSIDSVTAGVPNIYRQFCEAIRSAVCGEPVSTDPQSTLNAASQGSRNGETGVKDDDDHREA